MPISAEQDTAGPLARTVSDAAALLSALAGADGADPATAQAAAAPTDYTRFLDPGALHGARLGVWRDGCRAAGQPTLAVLDAAVALLRERGATVLDPVDLPDAAKPGGARVRRAAARVQARSQPLPAHPARPAAALPG